MSNEIKQKDQIKKSSNWYMISTKCMYEEEEESPMILWSLYM